MNMKEKKVLRCEICGQYFNHLGSHIAKKHKILASDYKKMYGLSINHSLISPEIKEKKRQAFEEDREKYLLNLANSQKYQFKKGHYSKTYYSKESYDKAIDQLNKINSRTSKNCPICNMKSKHLESHLYNKHGLLYVKKSSLDM